VEKRNIEERIKKRNSLLDKIIERKKPPTEMRLVLGKKRPRS